METTGWEIIFIFVFSSLVFYLLGSSWLPCEVLLHLLYKLGNGTPRVDGPNQSPEALFSGFRSEPSCFSSCGAQPLLYIGKTDGHAMWSDMGTEGQTVIEPCCGSWMKSCHPQWIIMCFVSRWKEMDPRNVVMYLSSGVWINTCFW